MKSITLPVTLLVVLQVLPQRQQMGQVVVQGPPQSPIGVAEPLAVLNAERAWSGADVYWLMLDPGNAGQDHGVQSDRKRDPILRRYALRALGRVEDPAQVRRLLALKDEPFTPVANTIAQSLHGFDPQNDPQLLADVVTTIQTAIKGPPGTTGVDRMFRTADLSRAMSQIAYASESQLDAMESQMREALSLSTTSSLPSFMDAYLTILHGFEALGRVNTKIVHYDDDTIEWLEKAAKGETVHGDRPDGRLYAFMALVNARALTPEVERIALKDEAWPIRRAAATVLAGSGGGLDEMTRLVETRTLFKDDSAHVRYEAVRAWGRFAAKTQGCQPLVDALKDDDQYVVLQAFDLLGTLCLDDEGITKRVEAETAIPTGADWPRPTHAFVALAKRSTEKSAIHMEAFTTHPVWWVRMYAAFAAAGAKDVLRLDRLAYDENDNVREAAIPYLHALDPDRAERAILAALERTDIQLVHTVAGFIKEAPPSGRYVALLVSSLDRLTRLHSMTSRDGRMALLDAIDHHATPDDTDRLLPWLKDFDPVVARRAAEVLSRLSGRSVTAQPAEAPHVAAQPFPNLRQCVVVKMASGKSFQMRMDPDAAPIAVEQFLKLATIDHYYDGLTFHRVVPNFVLQGGSPGANEYSGNKEYWRDEIEDSNPRGSVGLSIRGRNTGDAQFYINLVDNPRLDGGYTVFAHVNDMDVVDRIQEGDVMRSIGANCWSPRQ